MDLSTLDFLVKLASLAAFATALFLMVWAAVRLKTSQPPPHAPASCARLTTMCTAIAVIAGVAGLASAFLNYHQVVDARNQAQAAQNQAADTDAQLADALTQIDDLSTATRRGTEAERQLAGATRKSAGQSDDLATAQNRLGQASQTLRFVDSQLDKMLDAVTQLNLPPGSGTGTLTLRSLIAETKTHVRDALQ